MAYPARCLRFASATRRAVCARWSWAGLKKNAISLGFSPPFP